MSASQPTTNPASVESCFARQDLLIVSLNAERCRCWLEGFSLRGAKPQVPAPLLRSVDALRFCFAQGVPFRIIVVDAESLPNASALCSLLKELFPKCLVVLVGSDSQTVGAALCLASPVAFEKLVQRIEAVFVPSSSSKPSLVSPAEGAALRRRAFEYFSEMLDPDSARELMTSSLKSVGAAIATIEECRESEQHDALLRSVHGLKGILLNSGLSDEGASAASIEHSLKHPGTSDWQEALDLLLMKLQSYVALP